MKFLCTDISAYFTSSLTRDLMSLYLCEWLRRTRYHFVNNLLRVVAVDMPGKTEGHWLTPGGITSTNMICVCWKVKLDPGEF